MTARIQDLCPTLQIKAMTFFAHFANAKLIQAWRDPAYQDALHAKGISSLTGEQSLHCCTIDGDPAARAFDFGMFDDGGNYVKDGTAQCYSDAGEYLKSIGLVWGGDFVHPRPDYDHAELPHDAPSAIDIP